MQVEIIHHEPPYRVGVIVGSLSRHSINRRLAKALARLAPPELLLHEIPYADLPVYNRDLDADYPLVALDFKAAVGACDALMFVTPEYNRSIPGALKNAIDWGSRPHGQNVWSHKPTAVLGASTGQLGTALAQQTLRATLSFLNARQMNSPEAYIRYTEGLIDDAGAVTVPATESFLRDYLRQFLDFTARVLTVVPRR
jgi:chromate reductase